MGLELYWRWKRACAAAANWRAAADMAFTDEHREACVARAAECAEAARELRKQLDEQSL